MTGHGQHSYRVTRTRVVVETVTVHRMPSLEAAIRAVDEGVDDGTLNLNEAATTEPWAGILLCPHCGEQTMTAPDGWTECTSLMECGWTAFDDALKLARAAGLA